MAPASLSISRFFYIFILTVFFRIALLYHDLAKEKGKFDDKIVKNDDRFCIVQFFFIFFFLGFLDHGFAIS